MDFRLATINDLNEIKLMYSKLIDEMNKNGIEIWDEIYPNDYFINDIENKSLYVLLKDNKIVGAFALSEEHKGEKEVEWENTNVKCLYIDRLGVNVECTKKGIGTELLSNALRFAKEKTVDYLRLFVIDYNIPAIKLYEKFGFKKVSGIYNEVIDESLIFNEYGYEIKVN